MSPKIPIFGVFDLIEILQTLRNKPNAKLEETGPKKSREWFDKWLLIRTRWLFKLLWILSRKKKSILVFILSRCFMFYSKIKIHQKIRESLQKIQKFQFMKKKRETLFTYKLQMTEQLSIWQVCENISTFYNLDFTFITIT